MRAAIAVQASVVGDLVHEGVGQLEYDRAGLVVDHPGGRQHGVAARLPVLAPVLSLLDGSDD